MTTPRNFTLDISRFTKMAKTVANFAVQKTVIDIGTRVVERSPVGNPELWAINHVQMMNRQMFREWEIEEGRKPKSNRAVAKLFPTRGPKGYIGGRFRANWQYGLSSMPGGELAEIDPSGAMTIARLIGSVPEAAAGHVHYIVNNLPYAQPLEDGHSTQAPNGMVAITVTEFQAIVNKNANEGRAQHER